MYTKEEYEEKRNARYERLLKAAEHAERESQENWNRARSMASVIPFGHPILIGHHSEGRDRNYRARIESKHRKGYELHKKAEEYASRAASVGSNDAIYSDDPEAVEKIGDKLSQLLALQARYKAINAAHVKFLKDPASLDKSALSLSDKKLVRDYVPDWNKHPIAGYQLTNLSANIRRLKERSKIVERKQAAEDTEEEIGGIKFEYVPTENRIRITFAGRVSPERFKELRQHGYRLAKSFSDFTFSAYHNNNAKWLAEKIKEEAAQVLQAGWASPGG